MGIILEVLAILAILECEVIRVTQVSPVILEVADIVLFLGSLVNRVTVENQVILDGQVTQAILDTQA